MIKTLDRIILTTDLPEHQQFQIWPSWKLQNEFNELNRSITRQFRAKTWGSFQEGAPSIAKFGIAAAGETVAVVSLLPDQVRAIGRREIAQARAI